jgi:hypothetical protein
MVGGRRPAHQPRNNNRYSTKGKEAEAGLSRKAPVLQFQNHWRLFHKCVSFPSQCSRRCCAESQSEEGYAPIESGPRSSQVRGGVTNVPTGTPQLGLWPVLPTTISSSVQPEFGVFLAQVSNVMSLKPSTEGAVLVFDEQQIHDDLFDVQHFDGDLTAAMDGIALFTTTRSGGCQPVTFKGTPIFRRISSV